MPAQLFTQYFLTDGIRATPERRAQAPAFAQFRDAARRLFQDFPTDHSPNETQTEQDLIRPLLQLLNWTDDLPQQTTSGGEDRPDLLLFPDPQTKTRASTSQASPYLEALAVAELKRFRRPLDTRGPGKGTGPQASSPHAQILRYLRGADSVTDGDLRWGILTNGAVWRLYDQKTRPRATAFYEADLQALLQANDQDALRTFHLLFRRSAFVRRPGAAAAFLETALAAGRRYEQRVAQSLAGVVFDRVFPRLLQALADKTDQPMPAIREAALIFLYRLLFVLYAEDRGLLPVNDAAYDDYGLRKRVRDDVAQRKTRSDTFSTTASSYYSHLTDLFAQIDQGDPSIGLPPYNGGLFAQDAAPLLIQVRLPDAVIADVVYDLSHTQDNGQSRYVNYRDMSVQQLGSLYERLLEQEPVLDADGRVHVRPNPYARKDSGSFYTPQDLVDLIVDQTLKPLIEERLEAFEARADELRSDRRPKAERRAELSRLDPAQAVLDLKVLDPAMGSGHFLVSAVDFLTDFIADLIEFAPAVPDWLDADDAYHSPLLDRVAAIRADILHRAHQSGWAVNQAQLTDQAIIRRLVLKRCIYGVDKNPLTVELAKVSLWLHSFTVGAPLSFLDHHLRCGDSLLGLRIADARAELQRFNVPMFVSSALQGVENAAHGMRQIEQLSDADVTEVHQSESLFQAVESATADLRGFLNTLAGLRWHTAGMRVRQRAQFESPLTETLAANPTQAFPLLTHAQGAEAASSPLQGERQIRASSPEVGEGSPGPGLHPSEGQEVGATSPGSRPLSPLPVGEGQGEGLPSTQPPAHPVHGEPGRSLPEARVEPPSSATNPGPPSYPSDVRAASPTRPSSARALQSHHDQDEPANSPGSRHSSPLQGERQTPAYPPEFGEGSSGPGQHPSEGPHVGATSSGSRHSSPLQGERQTPAYPPEFGEGSSGPGQHPSEGPHVGATSSGSRHSSPLQGERQTPAYPPEFGEGSSGPGQHPSEGPHVGATSSGSRHSSPLQGERQTPAYPPEFGEGSSGPGQHPSEGPHVGATSSGSRHSSPLRGERQTPAYPPKSVRGLPVEAYEIKKPNLRVALTHSSQAKPSPTSSKNPNPSPTKSHSFIGRPPSPASGATGKTRPLKAASTPSSAIPPGTASSSRKSNGSPPATPASPAPPPPPPVARASNACASKATPWPNPSTRPRPAPTASARSSALLVTTPCSAAATSTSTPSSSNAPCASSNPAASSASSPPPASTPTRQPPASSSPSPPPAASPASTTSRIVAWEPTSRPSSPTSTLASSSAPSSSADPNAPSPKPTAASSYPTPRPPRTPTAPSPSRPTTSPASTPTPAPLPSSAPAATPT